MVSQCSVLILLTQKNDCITNKMLDQIVVFFNTLFQVVGHASMVKVHKSLQSIIMGTPENKSLLLLRRKRSEMTNHTIYILH
jgi:hypothetical protein